MKDMTLDECVYRCMRDGNYWTFWELQSHIKEKTGMFFGEVIEKKRRVEGKGYKYKLTLGE